ncbi:MAG TPA: hypothetical protein VGC80_02565, partial [Acetobacteraceae bacterium]
DMPGEHEAWVPEFLDALAGEAADGVQLLFHMECGWFAARRDVPGRRWILWPPRRWPRPPRWPPGSAWRSGTRRSCWTGSALRALPSR